MRYIWQQKSWPAFRWDNALLIAPVGRARLTQGRLMNKVKALGLDLGREAEAKVVSEEALKTAAIEGERLDPVSVRSSVARRLGLPTAGLPPVERRVDGLVEVLLDATTYYKRSLTLKRIKGWQAALFPTGYSGLQRIAVGKWRRYDPMQVVSGPIGRKRIHFEAPPSRQIGKEIRQFLAWWHASLGKTEGLLRAGIAHLHFVTIHPFEDGNGRLARALADMALAQDEKTSTRSYSLSSQVMAERNTYYEVLERTQKGNGDVTEWLLWFVGCLERALHRSENLMTSVMMKADFWQRHAQTVMNTRQRKVVNRLLDVGAGGFEGGLTTRKYVSMTKVSRATAYREINDLVTKKALVPKERGGRSTSYSIAL